MNELECASAGGSRRRFLLLMSSVTAALAGCGGGGGASSTGPIGNAPSPSAPPPAAAPASAPTAAAPPPSAPVVSCSANADDPTPEVANPSADQGGNPTLMASPAGDAVVYAGDDPTNPLSLFGIPITARIQALSNALASGTTSDIDIVKRFMNYIDQFATGVASDITPDATVIERIGACTTFVHTLLALARCQNIQGQYVNLYNYPPANGHTVSQLQVGGEPILFDPTYNLWYSAKQGCAQYVLDYAATHAQAVTGIALAVDGGSARAGADQFTGDPIYSMANPQGIIGPANPMLFPLSLDLNSMPSLVSADFGAQSQGADYLGAASTNVEQIWTLSGLQVGSDYSFTLVPGFLGGDFAQGDNYQFEIDVSMTDANLLQTTGTPFDFSAGTPAPLVVLFQAGAASVTLTLTTPYRGPALRYVSAESFTLAASNGPPPVQMEQHKRAQSADPDDAPVRPGLHVSSQFFASSPR